jgi:hypothetical protein
LSLAVAAPIPAGAQAQTPTPANRDLSGIWGVKEAGKIPWAPNVHRAFAVGMALQPWAREHCRRVGCARGVRFTNEAGGNAYLIGEDPALKYCAPYGFPRIMINGGPMEIFQIANRVFMRFYRNNEMREIWTDGRGHPPDLDTTWLGVSIGRWDGDTLVVDTRGVFGGENGKYKWLDESGYPHSDALHVTERIRRTDRNTLRMEYTFEDPQAYTAPFRSTVIYELNPAAEGNANGRINEYIRCEDRIFAEGEGEAWPFFTGEEYPLPDVPPVGPEF